MNEEEDEEKGKIRKIPGPHRPCEDVGEWGKDRAAAAQRGRGRKRSGVEIFLPRPLIRGGGGGGRDGERMREKMGEEEKPLSLCASKMFCNGLS